MISLFVYIQFVAGLINDGTNDKDRLKQLEFIRDCWLNLKNEVKIEIKVVTN